jgi:hypothetical protein
MLEGMSTWLNDEREWNDKSNPLQVWLCSWEELAPNTAPFVFTSTASDAINLLPSVIVKSQSSVALPKKATVLCFDSCFGAARGPLAGLSFVKQWQEFGVNCSDCKIPSPHLYKNPLKEELTESELLDVTKKETEALDLITKKKHDDDSVGALLIEPIIGPFGVYFYRPEFISALRKLCDQLNILLVADETLTVGRTGKFFGFHHYRGFYPDFIVFGKGMAIAGLASCGKWMKSFNIRTWNQTTLQADAISLLKSSQILKRITDDKLLANIASSGQYLLQRLNTLDDVKGNQGSERSRGIGGLIFTKLNLPLKSAHSRLLPPISITIQAIDKVLSTVGKNISNSHCSACKSDSDTMVYCYGCHKAFHVDCIKSPAIDINPWYCHACALSKSITSTLSPSKSEKAQHKHTISESSTPMFLKREKLANNTIVNKTEPTKTAKEIPYVDGDTTEEEDDP